jgi:Uma2 family endonuclease
MLRCEDPPPMNTLSIRRPRRWTYADYCRIPPDRMRHEIIDGRHFVNPAPSPYHQTVATRLVYEFMRCVEKTGRGRVFSAPVDVHLGRGSVVQPDLVVLRNANRSIIGSRKLTGAPDLLVEILSPGTRDHDRRRKKARYERAGVREYWIVDPVARVVEQFVLRERRYRLRASSNASLRLGILRDLAIDLRGVW